jgi:cell pole-organizing protein PopZ
MRKPEQSPEPSIEEILASIRRIISDDGGQQKGSTVDSRYPQAVPDRESAPSYEHAREARSHHPQEARPGPVPRSQDEILELTEDFMLEEQSAEIASQASPAADEPSAHRGFAADAPSPAEGGAQERGLATVLSNVAAEVDRLASGETSGRKGGEFFDEGEQKDEATSAAAEAKQPSSAYTFPAERARGTPSRTEPAPAGPQPASPNPPAERPRMHSRQIWSARRLEGEAAPPPADRDVARPEPSRGSAVQQQGGPKGRDRWAEGVQMPVPETGPTMPFPYDSDEPDASASSSVDESGGTDASDDRGETETEKSFVGDFLTRVFGSSPQQEEETPLSPVDLKGKAESLANATISDFAADKLGAPVVADALRADKPFMDRITDSLESALAEAETMEEVSSDFEGATAEAAEEAAETSYHDELPEVPPPPPEPEFASFGVPGEEALAPPVSEPPPHNTEPALPASEKPASEPETAGPDLEAEHPDAIFREPASGQEARAEGPAVADVFIRPESPASAPQPQATHPAPDKPALGVDALPSDLEESIKEMLKPLIIQWLNDNLARIVEQAVREELAERRHDLSVLHATGSGQR